MTDTIMGRDIHQQPVLMQVDQLTWRPSAYALVLNHMGQILVVYNTLNQRYEFPGGGIEIEETFTEGLIREVWEETGLNVVANDLILMEEDFFLSPCGNQWHTIKCFYTCDIVDGELRATILGDEALEKPEWVDPNMLKQDGLTIGWDALRKLVESKNSDELW